MNNANEPSREWHYQLDVEGNFWHDGSVFDEPHVLKSFMRRMEHLPDGRYFALCQGEKCYFEPEDTVYVVQKIDIQPDQVVLSFQGGYQEILDPGTLHVGKDNVFYCQAREGRFEARFNRRPYLELARLIEYDPKNRKYFLPLGGKNYSIAGV